MSFTLFEICAIQVGDDKQLKRGVKAKCGHCTNIETIPVNTMQGHGGGMDENVIERMVSHKFEKHGWKIGKTASQHRCPQCFSAIKIASIRKSKENDMTDKNKIVPINGEAPRNMTRDERRIIFEKLNDVYVGEKVGYSENWNDDKVAKDLGVPRGWISNIREDMFGPDISEQGTKLLDDARQLLVEITKVRQSVDPLIQQLQNLTIKAEVIEQNLKKFDN